MSALDDHLKRHRRRLIEREEQAVRELLAAYDDIERDLKRAYRDLEKKVEAARAAGDTISSSWFYRERRLRLLLKQVEEQIVRFGGRVVPIVMREQRAAIRIAVEQTAEIFRLVRMPNEGIQDIGTTLTPRVIENAVGVMGDGSPLMNYFKEKLAPAVAETLKGEIIKAAATGTHFKTIARRLTQVGGITKHRAMSMTRTEVNRVRRETKRQIYEESSDVFSGWEWVANHSARTCVACIALDGTVYKLKNSFPQHINCKCDIIPVSILFPRPARTIGGEWFARQSPDTKKAMLGTDAFDAFQRGDVRLKDFVGWATSKEFGKRVYTKKLADVLKSVR